MLHFDIELGEMIERHVQYGVPLDKIVEALDDALLSVELRDDRVTEPSPAQSAPGS